MYIVPPNTYSRPERGSTQGLVSLGFLLNLFSGLFLRWIHEISRMGTGHFPSYLAFQVKCRVIFKDNPKQGENMQTFEV